MFPLESLPQLDYRFSQTDKTILAPAIQRLIDAANLLDERLRKLEPVAVPEPVRTIELTPPQEQALEGVQPDQEIQFEGAGVILTVLIRNVRVVAPAPAPPPGVPVIGVDSSSVSGGSHEEGNGSSSGSVTVSNIGTGTLEGLDVSAVTYTQGSSGWLSVSWDGVNSQADYTFTRNGLAPGNYAATFDITASNAEPLTVTAILEIREVAAPEGDFPAPSFALPSFVTHNSTSDDLAGDPETVPDAGYYS